MRALVINLDRATARMDFQRWQLERLGIAFDRLPAVTTDDAPDRDEEYWSGWQRPLAPAERACLRSHRAAWQRVAEGAAPLLILEDDALLSDDVSAVLAAAEGRDGMDLLQLETRRRAKILGRRGTSLGPVQAFRLYVDRAGAAGYVLWPTGAGRLLAEVDRRPALADALIARPGLLRAYQSVPALIVQNDVANAHGIPPQWPVEPSSVSSVAHRGAGKSPQQKQRRLLAQLELGWRSAVGAVVHQKRVVPFQSQHFTPRG